MIVGSGVDLVENRRFERELAKGEWAAGEAVFTDGERNHCAAGKNPALRYAACFAAKEATLKALGVELSDLGLFREVEVKAISSTEYTIELYDRLKMESEKLGGKRIYLSIARDGEQTVATVIVEG